MNSITVPLEPLRFRRWIALPMAALGGFLLDLATPAVSFWPAVFLGAILVTASVWQQRIAFGALAGAVAGAAFWLPHISWLSLYLGPVPWLALSAVMIAWFALFGCAAAITTRGLAAWLRGPWLLVGQSLGVAGLWVLREQVQSVWPYGGFAWGRLAHPLADSPFVALVSWVGFAGLSALVALIASLSVACLLPYASRALARQSNDSAGRDVATRAALSEVSNRIGRVVTVLFAWALLALTALVPPASLVQTGSLRVAGVQGDSKSGVFDDRESGGVIRDHLSASQDLLDELDERDETVDLIVWPENSAEFALPEHVTNGFMLQRLAARAKAPIVVGSVLQDPDGTFTNSSLVWTAKGDAGVRYDKRNPVPFAEYMPNRNFFHALVPELVDLVQLEYSFGARPAVFDVPLQTREAKERAGESSVAAGLAICFDIIFDRHATAMIDEDAQVILAQTNNADFGRTDQSAQQLQIARLRAVETGRALVNISTVGTSAIIAPDGTDLDRLPTHVAGALLAEVPLVTGKTPALAFGSAIVGFWIFTGAVGCALGAAALLRERVRRR